MRSIATARINSPIRLDDARIIVHFDIETPADGGSGTVTTVQGFTIVSTDGSRVRVETDLEGHEFPVLSHKLDPNEPENEFDVVAQEIVEIVPFALPVTTTDVEQIACVVHNYVINARPEWS